MAGKAITSGEFFLAAIASELMQTAADFNEEDPWNLIQSAEDMLRQARESKNTDLLTFAYELLSAILAPSVEKPAAAPSTQDQPTGGPQKEYYCRKEGCPSFGKPFVGFSELQKHIHTIGHKTPPEQSIVLTDNGESQQQSPSLATNV
jgi:hypothetical protein